MDAYRYAADKLANLAGDTTWPLAMIYFNAETRGLQVAILPEGAELLVGHGRKIGVRIEAQARALCTQRKPTPGPATRVVSPLPGPPDPPPTADGAA